MKEALEACMGDHAIYSARRKEYDTGQKIPFRVSPTPFVLDDVQKKEVMAIGSDVVSYFSAIDILYKTDERAKKVLDTGKPEIVLGDAEKSSEYLFVRPDLIITPHGFSICEIETSPFGLALAEILNKGYQQEGFETMVDNGTLPGYVQNNTPVEGRIIYSNKTSSYSGQMSYLAEEIFSNSHRTWKAQDTQQEIGDKDVYRGFYLADAMTDPELNLLLRSHNNKRNIIPSITPHMEEKANLAFIWDKRFEEYFKRELGEGAFAHLRDVIPPTWIVGQEEYFAPGLPNGYTHTIDLANLSKAKRTYVLKPSGFGEKASWAEGVQFLHKKSAVQVKEIVSNTQQDSSMIHVVQEFTKGDKIPMEYTADDGEIVTMQAKIRLTPYFSTASGQEGNLVAIKATGCENTDFIHASSVSINTAVG